MAERHRSLKVSIGAYSCAVSGFDDPHAAILEATALMRTIAADPRNEALLRGLAGTDEEDGDEDEADVQATIDDRTTGRSAGLRDDADALSSVIARLTGRAVPAEPAASAMSHDGPSEEACSVGEQSAVHEDVDLPGRQDADAAGMDVDGPAPMDGDAARDGRDADQDLRDTPPADDPGRDAGHAEHSRVESAQGGATSARRDAPQDAPEAAVDRLLDVANHQLDQPETTRRLTAVRRMRHAVLATAADRSDEGTDPVEDERRNAFGDDFDRAMGRAGRTPPSSAEASPLILVSSQRIDVPPGGDPIRTQLDLVSKGSGTALRPGPEQVSATMDALAGELPAIWKEESAVTLRDRMASAARALSDRRPENDGSFARPDLMTVLVGGLESADSAAPAAREDRLRTFAALLEDGTLHRISRGLYVAAGARTAGAAASGS